MFGSWFWLRSSLIFAVYGMTGWIASYLVDEFNMTMNKMAMMSALIGLVMMLSAMFAGSMIVRYFKNREKQVIFVVSALGGVVAFLLSSSPSLVVSMLLLSVAVAAAGISCDFDGFTSEAVC